MMRGTSRKVVVFLGSIAAALAVTAAALAASNHAGLGNGSVVLANATSVNEVNFNSDKIKLRTKGPITSRVVHSYFANGFSSGWHVHPGPAIVSVEQGTLTITQGSCEGTTVGPGQAYLETPGIPVIGVATGEVEWTTTLLLPVGEPPAHGADSPCP